MFEHHVDDSHEIIGYHSNVARLNISACDHLLLEMEVPAVDRLPMHPNIIDPFIRVPVLCLAALGASEYSFVDYRFIDLAIITKIDTSMLRLLYVFI